MVWKGVVIEESLENKDILKLVKIIDTKKTTLEKEEDEARISKKSCY